VADGIGGGVERRRLARRRQRRTRRSTIVIAVVAGIFGVLVVAGIVAVVSAADYVDHVEARVAKLNPLKPPENSVIYARDGSLLARIASDRNRTSVPLSRISKDLQNATVAIEDKRFFDHGGVDWYGIARAAAADIRAGSITQGGSTLTQQLVKNLYGDQLGGKFQKKIDEAILAMQLEQRLQKGHSKEWAKEKILELYLNTVPYGHHAYGVEAAARTFFNRRSANLTLPQAALIAGLPQAPSGYDPFAHPQAARNRRNEVLKAMYGQGSITKAQLDAALAAPVRLRPGKFYGVENERYFSNYVKNQIIGDNRFGQTSLEEGGLRIYTTISEKLQAAAQRAFDSVLHYPPCAGYPRLSKTTCDPASALVTINPHTGEILAMASTTKFRNTQFNLAAQGKRQAGSTFKVFTLTQAIQDGIPLDTTYESAPFHYGDRPWETQWAPFDVHTAESTYSGATTIERGTLESDNTVYVQLGLDVGPDKIAAMAHTLGIRSKLDPVPTLTLGTSPVSPLELTNAYATIAAGGVYRPAHGISKIRFTNSSKVIRFATKGRRVLSDGVAAEVTRVLGENIRQGTGVNAHLADDRPEAGKTGTNDAGKDAWFCGYTPDLATCVWVGYPIADANDPNRPDRSISMYGVEGQGTVMGPNLPAMIWHDYMTAATEGTPANDWPAPKTPVQWLPFFNSHYTGLAFVAPPAPPPPPKTTTATGTTTTGPAPTSSGGGGGTTGPAPTGTG
jgi:penicillin-binding protein 1A